jgi:hypothetical protein
MDAYGTATKAVEQLIARAGALSLEEAADLYRAHGARILTSGSEAQRRALQHAQRVAARSGRTDAYELARHAAATAWRHALPSVQGPWLLVGQAISNAAGALVLRDLLDEKDFLLLAGPWRQAMGALTPVGPGIVQRREVAARR